MKKFFLRYRAPGCAPGTFANSAKTLRNSSNQNTKAKIPRSRVDHILYHNQNIGKKSYHVFSMYGRAFMHQEDALIAQTLRSKALSEERKVIFRH